MDRYVEEKSYYIYEVSVSGGSFKACFIDYAKAFDCVDHNKVWKILKEMGILDLPLEKPISRSGSNS